MVFAIWLAHRGQVFELNGTGGWAIELQGLYLFTAIAIALLGPGKFALNAK
jgi:putative oxidoreductase